MSEAATASSQPQPSSRQPAATPPSPRRAQSGSGAASHSPASDPPLVTPYLPPVHLDNTLPDPCTPYLLVLSLFLWNPNEWTSNTRSVLLHLLRFVFSRTQPPRTTEATQNTSTSPQANSSTNLTPGAASEGTSVQEPSASGSQSDQNNTQSGARAIQSDPNVMAWWQEQSDEKLWKVAAPMLRLFGLVHHLQSQLKASAEADWITATRTRCKYLYAFHSEASAFVHQTLSAMHDC